MIFFRFVLNYLYVSNIDRLTYLKQQVFKPIFTRFTKVETLVYLDFTMF